MKKILLIPTLLTVASTPLISLVGCGKNTFELTHHFTITDDDYEFHCLRTEEKVDLQVGKTYTALINVADFSETSLDNYYLSFWIASNEAAETVANIATAAVKVDGRSLTCVDGEPGPWEFDIYSEEVDNIQINIGPDTIAFNSRVIISFSLKKSVEQYYLISCSDGW